MLFVKFITLLHNGEKTGGSTLRSINYYEDVALIIQCATLPVFNRLCGICYTSEVGNIHASKALKDPYKA